MRGPQQSLLRFFLFYPLFLFLHPLHLFFFYPLAGKLLSNLSQPGTLLRVALIPSPIDSASQNPIVIWWFQPSVLHLEDGGAEDTAWPRQNSF